MTINYDTFDVSRRSHWLSGSVSRLPRFWIRLGCLETAALAEELKQIAIIKPVYVAGLARSGSTILLEFLARHGDVATHRYSDFPLGLFIPRCWARGARNPDPKPRERVHADGLQVTQDSPEAMEEVIWMAFFSELHNPNVSQVMTGATKHRDFEEFYVDHIRKLLLVRQRARYASKGNYNISRLQYLRRLFPDARFVVPVRNPVNHIASLMKQQRLFSAGETRFPRALAHMNRVGHYEFGLNRQPINVDNNRTIEEVCALWQSGDEVRGWARYWASLYGWLHQLLQQDKQLAAASVVVRYEDLCAAPEQTLRSVLAHCCLAGVDLPGIFAAEIQAPQYYRPNFSDAERSVIEDETRDIARHFGYDGDGRDQCDDPLALVDAGFTAEGVC